MLESNYVPGWAPAQKIAQHGELALNKTEQTDAKRGQLTSPLFTWMMTGTITAYR